MKDYKRFTFRSGSGIGLHCDNCKYYKKCSISGLKKCGASSLERLTELEDKIENGTLIDLPCKIGDTVWLATPDGRLIYGKVSAIGYKWETDASNNSVSQYAYFMARCPEEFYVKRGDDAIYGFSFENNKIGERVFLSEDEARKKLEKLEK